MSRVLPVSRVATRRTAHRDTSPIAHRPGITLMEVLISMFVLLFGLMGVAAIFPVGNHYVVQGEKFDRGNALADNAFQEIRARGMLAPETWLYANSNPVMDFDGTFTYNPTAIGPGHAFVIDPMSTAEAIASGDTEDINLWPRYDESGTNRNDENPWKRLNGSIWYNNPNVGSRWPVRRVSLFDPVGSAANNTLLPIGSALAESIFRLRDDLSVEFPERDDYPGTLRWQSDSAGNPLVREYKGNFSWLATVVPLTTEGLSALQPSDRSTHNYEVSVVVFYKRVNTPSALTERMIEAELLTGGELVMYGNSGEVVDKKFEKVKAGDWVAVMGVNETTGSFMLKWYRMMALEEEAHTDERPSDDRPVSMRRAMLQGPDWHIPVGESGVANLRVAIFPGIASVVTREMELSRAAEHREVVAQDSGGSGGDQR